MVSAVLFLAVSLAADVDTQELRSSSIATPDLPTSMMQIPWKEFRGMLDAVEAAKKQLEELQRPKKAPEAPVPYSIAEAEYTAEALDRNSLRVDLSMTIQIWAAESWVRIPVIGDSVAPVSVSLDNERVPLLGDQDGWLTLLVRTPGEHTFAATFYTPVTVAEGVHSFEFACAESALTTMTLRIAQKDAVVSAKSAAHVSSTVTDTALETKLAYQRTPAISAEWSIPAPQVEAPPPPEPRVACSSFTLATITEDNVTCKTVLKFTVLRGGVDRFALAVPSSVSILSVVTQASELNNAPATAWSQSPMQDNLTRVDIIANHQVEDTYALELVYEAPYTGDLAIIPEARVLDVVRESGYVGVAARGNIEIQPSKSIEGYIRLDVGELPTELRSLSPSPLLLAFRGGEGTRSLGAGIHRLDDVAVPDSSIESALLTTLVTDDGMAVTRAVYSVRNSVRQFLRVTLDKGAEVWSTQVAGQVVKPGRDSATGDVVIPLFKSVEVNRRLDAFPVEMVYMQRVTPPRGLRHSVDLMAPAVDFLAGEVYWDVMLPRTRTVYRSAGDLKPLRTLRLVEESPPAGRTRPRAASKSEKVYRLREGIERFFISDINNSAASLAGNPNRYKGAPLAPEQVSVAPAAATVSGVLPVAINVPTDGVRYSFERVLVSQGQPLRLALQTSPSWIGRGLSVARDASFFILGMGAVLVAGRFLLRAKRKYAAAVAAFLVALLCIGFHRFAPFDPGFVYAGAACGAVLLAVPALRRLGAAFLADRRSELTPTQSVGA